MNTDTTSFTTLERKTNLTYKMTKTKGKHPKNRQNKLTLVFDENKRREFLTGFHKRKLQRKKQAQEKLQQQLKEEKKRLKAEAKETYKKLLGSHRPIPEVDELLKEEYEEDNVTVKVVELSAERVARENNWIGPNQVQGKDDSEEELGDEEESEVPGMDLKPKVKRKTEEKKVFHSDKEVKKELKKQATRHVKKSKVFQKKNKMERQKQKKKSLKQKQQKEKSLNGKTRFKKKGRKQRTER